MTQNTNNIDWIFDVNGNIIVSRIIHFVDEARRDSKDFIWRSSYGESLLNILEEICKKPTLLK
jgi:hypothetical protein